MDIEEKDWTDVGLSNPVERMSDEARATLRERARRLREESPSEPALPEQRSRAMEWLRAELGWTRPSQAPALKRSCPNCGAETANWCRVNFRTVPGRLCNERVSG